MMIQFTDERPIFLQIAELIEDSILSGAFQEESQIPSITEFSVSYKINPATALKGINLLVDAGVLYKKRGVGMFVADKAVGKLKDKRKDQFYEHFIAAMVAEAKRLALSKTEVIQMIERGFSE